MLAVLSDWPIVVALNYYSPSPHSYSTQLYLVRQDIETEGRSIELNVNFFRYRKRYWNRGERCKWRKWCCYYY